jgi:hypothetical protein
MISNSIIFDKYPAVNLRDTNYIVWYTDNNTTKDDKRNFIKIKNCKTVEEAEDVSLFLSCLLDKNVDENKIGACYFVTHADQEMYICRSITLIRNYHDGGVVEEIFFTEHDALNWLKEERKEQDTAIVHFLGKGRFYNPNVAQQASAKISFYTVEPVPLNNVEYTPPVDQEVSEQELYNIRMVVSDMEWLKSNEQVSNDEQGESNKDEQNTKSYEQDESNCKQEVVERPVKKRKLEEERTASIMM